MTDISAAELEVEAEFARARVADTAESIRNKMTPGQLIDEFSGLFSGSDGVSALTTLKGQVSQNPLAISLVGAGLAWLMLGNTNSPKPASSETYPGHVEPPMSGTEFYSQHTDTPPMDYASDEGKSIGDRLSEASDSVASIAGSAAEAVKGAVASTKDQLKATTDAATSRVSSVVDSNTIKSARDAIANEPLVLAALGLALGTAIGAMLPNTALEDEQLGGMSSQLRDKAREVLDKGMEGAKDVAAGAYQSLKEAADDASEAGASGSVVDKVTDVLKTVAEKTEASVREKLPDV